MEAAQVLVASGWGAGCVWSGQASVRGKQGMSSPAFSLSLGRMSKTAAGH